MRLIRLPEQLPGYPQKIVDDGLTYNDTELPSGEVISYFDHRHYVEYTLPEIKALGHASARMFWAVVAAGDYMINKGWFPKMGIPPEAIPAIVSSWNDDARYPNIYGRFDWAHELDPETNEVIGSKLLEFNADTPTGVPETVYTMPKWLEDAFPQYAELPDHQWPIGQWTAEYIDHMVEVWVRKITDYREATGRPVDKVFFAYTSEDASTEDQKNTQVMQEIANMASAKLREDGLPGFETELIVVETIKAVTNVEFIAPDTSVANPADFSVLPAPQAVQRNLTVKDGQISLIKQHDGERVVSIESFHASYLNPDTGKWEMGDRIDFIWKLYPWEWLFNDKFGIHALDQMLRPDGTTWVEPPYKALWSNKALLVALWELFGDPMQVYAKMAEAGMDPKDYQKRDPSYDDPRLGDPTTIHQYLLPSFFEDDPRVAELQGDYAKKPLLGREGADTTLYMSNKELRAGDKKGYGVEGFILQQLSLLPRFDREGENCFVVSGVYMADDTAAALINRGSENPVTGDYARCLPHVIIGLTNENKGE